MYYKLYKHKKLILREKKVKILFHLWDKYQVFKNIIKLKRVDYNQNNQFFIDKKIYNKKRLNDNYHKYFQDNK